MPLDVEANSVSVVWFNGKRQPRQLDWRVSEALEAACRQRAAEWLLIAACRGGGPRVVRHLLESFAFLNLEHPDVWTGATPLILAANHGHLSIVKSLLQRGANVHANDRFGTTALHAATSQNRTDCVKLLLEHGADPNKTYGKGCHTPLITACKHGYRETAAVLLAHGADAGIKDSIGWTPEDHAAYGGWVAVCTLLKEGVPPAEPRDPATPAADPASGTAARQRAVRAAMFSSGEDVGASGNDDQNKGGSNGKAAEEEAQEEEEDAEEGDSVTAEQALEKKRAKRARAKARKADVAAKKAEEEAKREAEKKAVEEAKKAEEEAKREAEKKAKEDAKKAREEARREAKKAEVETKRAEEAKKAEESTRKALKAARQEEEEGASSSRGPSTTQESPSDAEAATRALLADLVLAAREAVEVDAQRSCLYALVDVIDRAVPLGVSVKLAKKWVKKLQEAVAMQQTLQALVEVAAQDPNAPPLSRLPEVQATMALARKATVSPALLESSEAVLQVMEARAEARAEAAKPTVSTPPTRPPAYRPPVARAPPPRYVPSAVLRSSPLSSLSSGAALSGGPVAPSVADTIATGVTAMALGPYGCTVCMERYVDLQVACGHLFCSTCWEGWMVKCRGRELHCPICRMAVHPGHVARFMPPGV